MESHSTSNSGFGILPISSNPVNIKVENEGQASTVVVKTSNAKGSERSIMWLHFTKRYDDKGNYLFAVCNYCDKECKANTVKHGTSGLHGHLYRCKASSSWGG